MDLFQWDCFLLPLVHLSNTVFMLLHEKTNTWVGDGRVVFKAAASGLPAVPHLARWEKFLVHAGSQAPWEHFAHLGPVWNERELIVSQVLNLCPIQTLQYYTTWRWHVRSQQGADHLWRCFRFCWSHMLTSKCAGEFCWAQVGASDFLTQHSEWGSGLCAYSCS